MHRIPALLFAIAVAALFSAAASPRSVAGPLIQIEPDSLSDSLLTGGTSQHPLTIRNLGDATLDWAFASGIEGVRILITQINTNDRSTLVADLESQGAFVEPVIFDIAGALPAYDILWMTAPVSGLPQADMDAIADWLNIGGSALFEGSNDIVVAPFNGVLSAIGSGIVYSPVGAATGITAHIFPHPTTVNVFQLFLAAPNIHLSSTLPPSTVLFRDTFNNFRCGAAAANGTYKVVALADELFLNSWINSLDNDLFANQVFDYLAPTTPVWLDVSDTAGSIAPADSAVITVTFDAQILPGGDYSATLRIDSNDTGNPSLDLPLALHVTGAGVIELSDTTLNFGGVFQDSTKTRTLTITNTGFSDLIVSDISSDEPDFSPDSTSMTVPIGQNRNVIVSFTPSSLGPITGTLSIASNDLANTVSFVSLNGNGLEYPNITVTPPDSITAAVNTNGVAMQTVVIRNNGVTPFQWNTPGALKILYDVAHSQTSIVASRSAFYSLVQSLGVAIEQNGNPITAAVLAPYDIFWCTEMNLSWAGSEITALRDWIQGGGGAFLVGDVIRNVSSYNTLSSQLSTNISWSNTNANVGVTNVILPHPTTEGILSVMLPDPDAQLPSVNPPAELILRDIIGVKVGGATVAGAGRMVAISDGLVRDSQNSVDNFAFGLNILNWLGNPPLWLAVQPTAGTIAPMDSVVLTVTFNANGLNSGVHDGALDIISPLVGGAVASIPARLTVIPAPDIVLSDSALVFDPRFIGDFQVKTLTITNAGTSLLNVSGVSIDNPTFVVNPTAFTLLPGQQENRDITFVPPAVGTHVGTLTMASDDPDEPVVDVSLSGDGILPPVMTVSPESLSVVLGPNESTSKSLTIANGAGTDLIARLAVFEDEGLRPAPPAPASTQAADLERLPARTYTSRPDRRETPGPMAISIATQPLTAPFDSGLVYIENFESGNFDDWTNAGGTGVKEVTPFTAANGSAFGYHESGSGIGHFDGIYQTFTDAQIRYVSFWVRSRDTALNDAYFVLRDTAGNEVLWFFASSLGTFYMNASAGGNLAYPYAPFTWYHIELENIDYDTKTFDYVVDDSLIQTGISFQDTTGVSSVSRLDLHNFSSGGEAWWDEITLSIGKPVAWASVTPTSVVVAATEQVEVSVNVDATGLAPGVYDALVNVNGNDPNSPFVLVPLHLVVDSNTVVAIGDQTPERFRVLQNHPNPFNPTTAIRYEVPTTVPVSLVVYNVKGEVVRVIEERVRAPGRYTAEWDGKNQRGIAVASGVYFYRLRAGAFVQTRKMVLLK